MLEAKNNPLFAVKEFRTITCKAIAQCMVAMGYLTTDTATPGVFYTPLIISRFQNQI